MADETTRQSIEQADITSLAEAYERMQALSDNRGWLYWCGIHGFPQYKCWHHARVQRTDYPFDLFLPWHRAYLLYFENAVRDQNDKALLAWWDWTSPLSHQIGIPAVFATETLDGRPNPFFSGPTPDMPDDPARRTRRFPAIADQLPTPNRIESLLQLGSFEDFTMQIQDVHDEIHGWAGGLDPNNPRRGGDMGAVASSAYDPIFWAHHCMIDRIWYLWQLQNGIFNIPPSYLDRPLEPFGFAVRDVLDIARLGYGYAVSSVVVAAPTNSRS
jgi:tyrosinase